MTLRPVGGSTRPTRAAGTPAACRALAAAPGMRGVDRRPAGRRTSAGRSRSCTSSGSRSVRHPGAAAEVLRVGPPAARHVPLDQRQDARRAAEPPPTSNSSVHAAGRGHLRRVADQTEAGDVGAARARRRPAALCSASAAARFSVHHRARWPPSTPSRGRALELERRRDDAGAERLWSGTARRRPRAGVRPDAPRSTSPVTA